jgi:hypothetical protein
MLIDDSISKFAQKTFFTDDFFFLFRLDPSHIA